MKGITEIDEQAAILLVRAYKLAYAQEGPRIRSEAWQAIAHQLNRKNSRNLTVTQWKKRISNIKSLVKLKHDMERRGRQVNWTSIEKEYLRLFPNVGFENDACSSTTSDGTTTGTSGANGGGLEEDDAMMLLDEGPEEEEEEEPPSMVSMVKTETPKWAADARQSLLALHRPLLGEDAVDSVLMMNGHTSREHERGELPVHEPPMTTLPPIPPTLTLPAGLTPNPALPLPPFLDLRTLLAQMDSAQRKRNFLLTLRSFRHQIDQFVEFLEQDLALNAAVTAAATGNGPF